MSRLSVIRLIFALALVQLFTACATRVQSPLKPVEPDTRLITFQDPALTPRNGGKLVFRKDLEPGDIILSAANGITSAGIRLLTLAPVSHAALYIGDDDIAEAVGEGVRVRSVADVLDEEAVVVAFRRPALKPEQALALRDFALRHAGTRYNHLGVLLQAPFSLERRVCELPLVPGTVRDFCLRGVAAIQLGASSNDRFFCSQFVLEAYRYAGIPITDADPRLISPADILHMREGDVPSVAISQPLVYVGHLKYQATAPVAALLQPD